MWSGTCAGGRVCQGRRCRRTECRPASPGTLLLFWSRRRGQVCQCLHYCVWQSNFEESRTDSRTCHYVPAGSHHSLLSSGCFYTPQLYEPHPHSTQPPSSSVQTDPLYTTPDTCQISLGGQDTAAPYPHMSPFCSPQRERDVCLLCLGPV